MKRIEDYRTAVEYLMAVRDEERRKEASIEVEPKIYDPTGWGKAGKERSALSATMPLGLSQAILEAVEASP